MELKNFGGFSAGVFKMSFNTIDEIEPMVREAIDWEQQISNGNLPAIFCSDTWINLTPDEVIVDGVVIEPLGDVARCEEQWEEEIVVGGLTCLKSFKYGKTNLPPVSWDFLVYVAYGSLPIRYIVSMPVAMAEPTRPDLFFPVGWIRPGEGQIIESKGLGSFRPDVQNKWYEKGHPGF